MLTKPHFEIPHRYKSPNDFEPTDARRMLPRFSRDNFAKNLDLVTIFEELAAAKQSQKGTTTCTPAQVVLVWILSQGPDIFPIPGTKTIEYLEQNLGAFSVAVSEEDDARIRRTIAAMGAVVGARTPVGVQQAYGDTPPL